MSPVLSAALLASLAVGLWLRAPAGRHTRPGDKQRVDGSLLPLAGVAGVVVVVYFMLGGFLGLGAGAVAGVAAWKALGRLEGRAESRRGTALLRLAPLVADLVAAALAVGRDPASALRLAAEAADPKVAEELAPYSASLTLGAEPTTVWRALGQHPQFGGVGRAFLRATETGSSVTEAMERGAEDLRAIDRSVREASARTVSTRAAAPLGICLLPAFVVVGIVPLVAGAVGQLLF